MRAQNNRTMQGQTSRAIINLQNGKSAGTFESFVARPGGVIGDSNWTPDIAVRLMGLIRTGDLAAALVDTALYGSDKRLLECQQLRTLGEQKRAVLSV